MRTAIQRREFITLLPVAPTARPSRCARNPMLPREETMAGSKPIRTYFYIGVAIVCFMGAVALGINLLIEPEINRGDVGALVAALGGLLTASSLLWIRYGQKPPTG
jgi:hypothetical protein